MAGPRIPTATYRLQFNRDFPFAGARELVPYLHELGISDIYASPVFRARQGSSHGYDVTDPGRLNPELGGEDDFRALAVTLRRHSMGLLLDIVPNHMAASVENPWWRDVLRHGRRSRYATYFDINWRPAQPELAGRVLLPILGEPFARVLEGGQLALKLTPGGLRLCYYETQLPLSPATCRHILAGWRQSLAADDTAGPDRARLKDILTTLAARPPRRAAEAAEARRRAREELWHLYCTRPGVKAFIDARLGLLNGSKEDPHSFSRLERILARQAYRLSWWRVSNEEINYRRFFDVSDLAAVRVEDREVFAAVHAGIFRLVKEGLVTGLRIDHIDGLYDPPGYLARLREHLAKAGHPAGFYVVAEKILSSGEELPANWPVHGTTGYDFLNLVNGLFIDREGLASLEEFYARYSGITAGPEKVVYNPKKTVLAKLFAAEVRGLVRELGRLAAADRQGHDLTLAELEEALIAVTAALPVYRTYIRALGVTEPDREHIENAVARALRESPGSERACHFLRRVLLLAFPPSLPLKQRYAWLRFARRWQQFTGAVMAKGYEDTALYIYNPLISLNEVGSSPRERGLSVAEFHRCNEERRKYWPHTLNATSTHDTKRSEDVRARINVLAEIPAAWARKVESWHLWNEPRQLKVKGRPVPDGNMELFIYQTLVGAWPLQEEEIPAFKERLQAYLIKAAREAKTHTSWLDPDKDYEEALEYFAAAILEEGEGNSFLPDFRRFQRIIAYYGAWNSLAQLLLKVTSPGVPDCYQGTELWNFSLVDPDNRRPVDFKTRSALLQRLKEAESRDRLALVKNLLARWPDGRVKLYLTYKSLCFRREHRELFAAGAYLPVAVSGPASEHACAFARQQGREWALVAVPRLPARLMTAGRKELEESLPPDPAFLPGESAWGETGLVLPEPAPLHWHNILTGELTAAVPAGGGMVLPLTSIWRNFPVALLAGV